MKDLKNRVAVVTGASSGIGKAIAESLAKEGCRVAIIARNPQKLEAAANDLKSSGEVKAFPCDLMDNSAFRETIKKIGSDLGPVEILVNNVGAGTFKPMHLMSEQEADMPIQLPFGISVVACHAVIPGMLERGEGHIVNMTSPAGIFPLPYMMPYTATRHGIVGLSYALYEELHHRGIGVSLMCPAQVNTGYFDNNDADMGWYPKLSKIFPVLEPEEVGNKVVFAIKNDKRQVVFPPMLDMFVRTYEKMPRVSIALFKMLGLWGPSKQV